jgi:drug/metabolite transporter (DMT)-like permease
MVFWVMAMMAAGATLLAAPSWMPLEARHLPVLAALAVSGFLAQLAITEAFSHGEASVVAPFEYTALAFGMAIDWLMWKTLPDGFTLLGAAIIIGSGLYLIRHETAHAASEHP